jgi:hypothetical protein
MVVANFERALTGWHPSRLLTEWVIFVNAIIATVLVLLLPRNEETVVIIEEENNQPYYKRLWIKLGLSLVVSSLIFFAGNRLIYQYPPYEKMNKYRYQFRFGPDATWKAQPNLKNAEHK